MRAGATRRHTRPAGPWCEAAARRVVAACARWPVGVDGELGDSTQHVGRPAQRGADGYEAREYLNDQAGGASDAWARWLTAAYGGMRANVRSEARLVRTPQQQRARRQHGAGYDHQGRRRTVSALRWCARRRAREDEIVCSSVVGTARTWRRHVHIGFIVAVSCSSRACVHPTVWSTNSS